jgi:aspartyl-tRNA(Asn)/glutamyl-tRNA(Gln) amidotransferase subunit B
MTNVSLVDAAMPGMLPVINEVLRGAGGAHRPWPEGRDQHLRSVFDRKNYFYPTCRRATRFPSSSSRSWARARCWSAHGPGRVRRSVGIERLHLEQDAGKSIHDQHPTMSYVDLNRSGVALMEIVSKPDMRSSDEAKAYVTKLRTILRYLGTCDGNMDEGSMRADVNVSVRKPGGELRARAARSRTSTPCASSARPSSMKPAARSPFSRTAAQIDQETRLFDPARARPARCAPRKKRTTTAISPIPTCCRWNSTQAFVDALADLPELPDEKKAACEGLSACRL